MSIDQEADPFHLGRFVAAQDADGTYDYALAQLRSGAKTSHWMWFVFPQVTGLGLSAMSRRYAIDSLEEAQAYLAHPVLGPRLLECVTALVEVGRDRTLRADDIVGAIDARKLQSSLTLFLRANPREDVLREALERYFDGAVDAATDELLAD